MEKQHETKHVDPAIILESRREGKIPVKLGNEKLAGQRSIKQPKAVNKMMRTVNADGPSSVSSKRDFNETAKVFNAAAILKRYRVPNVLSVSITSDALPTPHSDEELKAGSNNVKPEAVQVEERKTERYVCHRSILSYQ